MTALEKIAQSLHQDDLAHALVSANLTEQQLIEQLAELSKALRLEHARLQADREIKCSTYVLHRTEFQAGVRPDVADSLDDCYKANEAIDAFAIRVKALKNAAQPS